MVIAGIGALASLGLALPTGLAFGYGYGYGVRQGYHAFRPSKSSVTRDLHLNANPVKGAHGAGLLSAEEMTSKQAPKSPMPLAPQPSPSVNAQTLTNQVSTVKKPTDQAFVKSKEYSKDHFVRYEAGAVTGAIKKKKAWSMAYSAGIKDLSERNVRRLFIKKLHPFN